MLCTPQESRSLLSHALTQGYAILAVNADSHAAVTDVLDAALLCGAPVIIETSLWQLEGHSYGSGDAVLGLARYILDLAALACSDKYGSIPVILHTDHIKGPKTFDILGAAIRGIPVSICGTEIAAGASTISLDASELSDQENIATISRLAEIAEESGVPVTLEMESAVDKGITPPETTRILVGSVEEKHPGAVCVYAPGLGTRHGFSKNGYPEFNTDAVKANVALLEEITGRSIGLALHGSSGLSKDDLAAAASSGVVKVNWSTESLILRSSASREYYVTNTSQLESSHPDFKTTAMDNGVQRWVSRTYVPRVADRMRLLGGEGRAPSFLNAI